MKLRSTVALLVLAGAGLALASCQTLNEAECQTVSWNTLGQQDGAQGRPTTYIGRHQEACAKHGLPIDTVSWQAGWEQGIRQYCQPDNALNRGRNGQSAPNNCPADLSRDFAFAYEVGRGVYDAQTERDRLVNEMNTLTQSIVNAETTEERAVIQTRLVTVQAQVPEAERRLSRARERYEDYLFDVRLPAGQAYMAPQSPGGGMFPPPYAMTPAFEPPYRTRPAAY